MWFDRSWLAPICLQLSSVFFFMLDSSSAGAFLIFSNGRYKSVLHRAVVNNEKTRISVAMANGPSRDTVVCPAPQLVKAEGYVPTYVPIKYGDYLLAQQSNQLDGKSILNRVKIEE